MVDKHRIAELYRSYNTKGISNKARRKIMKKIKAAYNGLPTSSRYDKPSTKSHRASMINTLICYEYYLMYFKQLVIDT